MNAATEVLVAEQLVYQYPGQDEPALCGVDLKLQRGQAVGLLGPNGSGKSTFISLLLGLRTPQSGHIRHTGDKPPVIAWVPQEYAFYPELTCQENLDLFAGMLVLSNAEASRRIEVAIHSCMLQEFSHRRARYCSGGVQRRLNLAIALLQQPDLLLLDEPTVGVDPQSRAFLLDRVHDLVSTGTSVLYATHYMEEVSKICSHILLLDHGKVLASGDLKSLLSGSGFTPFENLESLFMHHTQRQLRD
ncbi:MAG: ABC transporter ATP-binding protein [Polaromonas sp.]